MPGEFESVLIKLQGKLGKQTIRRASTINRPRPKFEVQQIDIFNKFNRRNPKADGGSADDYEPSAFSKKVNELMDDGYDFGEAVREAMRQGYKDGGRIGFGKAGFVRSKGYRGYVSDERLKLEKKLPEIKKLYLSGLNDRGIAKKLNTTKKRIEVILDELRGKAVTNIGGKKVKSGYNIPEDTPRGKLYKANRITKAEEKIRGRGGSGGKTSPKSKTIIEAAKAEYKQRVGEDFDYYPLLGERDPPLNYRN